MIRSRGFDSWIQSERWPLGPTGIPKFLILVVGSPALFLLFFLASGLIGIDPPVGAQSASGGFDDIPSCEPSELEAGESCVENAHKSAIDSLYADGILDGTECRSGSFCPEKGITRWQMAVWLVRVVDGLVPTTGDSSFSDVSGTEWWAPYVGRLSELHITWGCGSGKFCPHDYVTRDQMASFLVRAFDLHTSVPVPFSDVPSGHTHASEIAALAANKVTVGCGNSRFCPDMLASRAQMATFLYRARNVALISYQIAFHYHTHGTPSDLVVGVPYSTDPDRGLIDSIRLDNVIPGEDECFGDLCSNQYWSDGYPSWSSEGSRIAFVHHVSSEPYIYIVNIETDTLEQLTPGSNPSWAPDRDLIAFVDNEQIYTIESNGSNRQQLTQGRDPSWLPMGDRIGYVNNGIHVMESDGTYVRQVTSRSGGNPSWSPDGRKIAYEGSYLFSDSYYSLDPWIYALHGNPKGWGGIVVVDAHGTNDFRIVNTAYAPVWKPAS